MFSSEIVIIQRFFYETLNFCKIFTKIDFKLKKSGIRSKNVPKNGAILCFKQNKL